MKIEVVRIIGNDLAPRHGLGAQEKALEYILENESPPKLVDTTFVLNRIIDSTALKTYREILNHYGKSYAEIPPGTRSVIDDGIDINACRNFIIDKSRRAGYYWCFPLDGRCFIPEQSFKEMKAQCAAYYDRPYAFMPQHRVKTYDEAEMDLRNNPSAFQEARTVNGITAYIRNEYAIGFSQVATELFNTQLPFGVVDKAEMLTTAGIPGPWINWVAAQEEKYPIRDISDSIIGRSAQYAGHCIVLPSLNPEADTDVFRRLTDRELALIRFQEARKCVSEPSS